MGVTWFADERLADLAATTPDGVALVQGERIVTWSELDARVTDAAAVVAQAGARPGDRVAVIVVDAASALAAILGVLRAGCVAAPVSGALRARERDAALAVVRPALVLPISGPDTWRASAGFASDRAARDAEAPAVIVLTSGTTGKPKGVVLSARALAASADAWRAVLPPATGWVLALGLGHVAGLGVVWRALADGVPVVIVPSGDPGALLAALGAPVGHDAAGRAPSHVSLVPGQLLRLLEATGDAAPPPSVLAVPLGGGAIPPALVVRALEAGWPIVSTYGLSEMGSGVTALPTAEAAQAPKTAGRPLPGLSITIDDPDRSGIGEITVSGPSRCSGYLGEPPVPATEPLRTGDLGRLDAAGRLVVVDRRTDRIVRGGENIDPSEVETVLEAHPAIAEACVVGRPDERWGSVPVAAMVLQPGAVNPPDDELTAHVRARLAGFKVPIAFARLDTLPRTASGKLRREAVRPFLAAERSGTLARPGGDAIGWRVTGDGPTQVLLLHGTVSSAAQLDRLATALAAALGATVHAIDRRGHGTSTLGDPTAIDAGTHVDDVVAYLDARGIGRIVVIGHSFGGVIGLELGARHRDRVRAIAAYEPPYGLLAEGEWRAWFERVATDTAAAHAAAGAAQASETFLRMVAGDAAWDRLPERARDFLRAQGDGALADSGLRGLDPDGLRRIAAPTLLLTGAASEPFYAPIADTLAARIHGARRATLAGATHTTPITDPAPVVAAIRDLLELPA